MKNPLLPYAPGRVSPWRAAADLHREIERWFGDRFPAVDISEMESAMSFSPACELSESDKEYVVRIDVPGINKEDLRIEAHGNELMVSGERKEEKVEKDRRRHFTESSYGSFFRSVTLPQEIDEKNVKAQCKDGVLTIHIAKSEKTTAKTIPVQ